MEHLDNHRARLARRAVLLVLMAWPRTQAKVPVTELVRLIASF